MGLILFRVVYGHRDASIRIQLAGNLVAVFPYVSVKLPRQVNLARGIMSRIVSVPPRLCREHGVEGPDDVENMESRGPMISTF